MSLGTADRVGEIPGVAAVSPGVMLLMDEEPGVMMGVPPMISGSVAGSDEGLETFVTRYAEGRALTADDEGADVAVLGSDIARKFSKHVGDTIGLRERFYTVVGVLEPTLTAPDQSAMVPMTAAQRLLVTTLPPMFQSEVDPADMATSMVVYVDPGVDIEALATEIERRVPEAAALTGADFDRQVGSATSILNSILIGVALISLVVGGLSVINTMAMSIAERTREIGVKRAIGGGRSSIVRELVAESALIGFIGGVVGLTLGVLVAVAANEAGRSSGTVLFEPTAWTAFTALAFGTGLGALAGFIPALHAARLDPVTALRHE
jgi:putative ABC transport system permease protein